MDMLDITFVLLGILSLSLALYLVSMIVKEIEKSRKNKEKPDTSYIFGLILGIIVFALISHYQFDNAYRYLVEIPRAEKLKEKKEEAEEKEEEAFRQYVLENGIYNDKELELVVVDKYTEHRGSCSRRYHRCRTDYIVVLEDNSGFSYKSDSERLFHEVKIGDPVIMEQTIVTDKNNGELLDWYDPFYYKKESI